MFEITVLKHLHPCNFNAVNFLRDTKNVHNTAKHRLKKRTQPVLSKLKIHLQTGFMMKKNRSMNYTHRLVLLLLFRIQQAAEIYGVEIKDQSILISRINRLACHLCDI
jgi:hypothetical protein